MDKSEWKAAGSVAVAEGLAVVIATRGGSSSAGGKSSRASSNTIKILTRATAGSPVAPSPEVQRDVQAAVTKPGRTNRKRLQAVFCNSKGDAYQLACTREPVQDRAVPAVAGIDLRSTGTKAFDGAGTAMFENERVVEWPFNGLVHRHQRVFGAECLACGPRLRGHHQDHQGHQGHTVTCAALKSALDHKASLNVEGLGDWRVRR